MRDLNANAIAKIATQLGTEPIIFIEIEWVDGTVTRYADKTVTALNLKGAILEISNLDEVVNILGSSTSATLNIVLDDTDGTIKALLDKYDLHKRPVRVKQYFTGLAIADAFTVFEGVVLSPVTWTEGNRQISFTIETNINSMDAGFAPEEGQYDFIPNELAGKTWPMVFGSCIHVPATKVTTTITGQVASLFGFPDVTLPLKLKFLKAVAIKTLEAYKFYMTVYELADGSAITPLDLQDDYIDQIIAEDQYKQDLEDQAVVIEKINDQLDELTKIYYSVTKQADRLKYKKKIKEVRELRDDLLKDLKEVYANLKTTMLTKQTVEVQATYTRYIGDLLVELRTKLKALAEDYIELQEKINEVTLAILSQQTLLQQKINIINGEKFPQNELIRVSIDGRIFTGRFDGNIFNVEAAVPTYRNIGVLPKTATRAEFDSFFIIGDGTGTDPDNILLDGHYALLPNKDIIKITSQDGISCKFSLIKRDDNKRRQKKEIEVNNANRDAIKNALSNVLTGNETNEQLQIIANEVPKDINLPAWQKLVGTNNQQTIRLTGDIDLTNPESTFTLTYDEFETQKYLFTASMDADSFKYALLSLTPFKHLGFDTEKITAVGDILTEDDDGKLIPDPDGVTITFNLDSWDTSENSKDPYPPIMRKIIIDSNELKIESGDDKKQPLLSVEVVSTGAHEYTNNEIARKIDEVIGKSQHSDALKAIKKKILELKKKAVDAPDAATQVHFEKAIQQNLAIYNRVIRLVSIPESVVNEAYKIINDQEYRFLFDMELLNYVSWKRDLQSYAAEPQDRADYYYTTNGDFKLLLETSPIILPHWVAPLDDKNYFKLALNVKKLPTTQAWVASTGSSITLEGDYQEQYVANIMPSTLHAVYARRNIDGRQTLVPVPREYYSYNESNNFGAYQCLTISLKRPLTYYKNDEWYGDGIWVTLTSSEGPNTADVIKWITEKYTDLTLDSTTYNEVKAAIANYPSHFAYFERTDALALIKDIAWQARCAAWAKEGKLYLRYLSTEPDSVATITESDIAENSIELTFTPSDDMVTKFTSLWKPTYFDNDDYKLILRHNIKRLKKEEREFRFFIYTNRDLVLKSSTYWMIRYANTWKKARFRTYLTMLNVESQDCVTLDLDHQYYTNDAIKCLVEKLDYDSSNNTIMFECWLPVLAGSMEQYKFAWPSDVEIIDVFPEPDVILSGNAGNILNTTVPNGQEYDPFNLDAKRPGDFGTKVLTDANDELPKNPVSEFDPEVGIFSPDEIPVFDPNPLDDGKEAKFSAIIEANDALVSNDPDPNMPPTFGRVIALNEKLSVEVDYEDVEGSEDFEPTTVQIYDVRLSDGRKIPVRQVSIHKDDRIPYDTVTLVVYDPTLKQYTMQVPTWGGDPDELDDLSEVT